MNKIFKKILKFLEWIDIIVEDEGILSNITQAKKEEMNASRRYKQNLNSLVTNKRPNRQRLHEV